MLNGMASKAVRLARGTALALGAAAMLALVLGVATTALAVVPGDPFKLGQLNTIDRVSQLAGSVAGPMLVVDNNGSGRALDLRVEPGKAPLKVSPGAGMATGLRAQDAKTADVAGFAQSAGEASDSDKLDGKDSSQFMTASTYVSESPVTSGQDIGNGTGIRHAEWSCEPGDQLLTGGYRSMVNATSVAVVGSYPSRPWGNYWVVEWANTADPNRPFEMQIYVKCADTAAPAHA